MHTPPPHPYLPPSLPPLKFNCQFGRVSEFLFGYIEWADQNNAINQYKLHKTKVNDETCSAIEQKHIENGVQRTPRETNIKTRNE